MSAGSDEPEPAPRSSARRGSVSVFAPGRPRSDLPVVLEQSTGRELMIDARSFAAPNPSRVWESLTRFRPDPDFLAGNGLFLDAEQHEGTRYFDMLRTRIAQAMAKEGWRSLAVTSPSQGCGKSFLAANLALALARLPSCRTVLMDLSLREPQLAGLFGLRDAGPLADYMHGEQPLEAHFRRLGNNLALALNGAPVARAAESLQDPEFATAFEEMFSRLQPDMVICDTGPSLTSDDLVSLAGRVDAVLLVVDGTRSTAEEIAACERLFEGRLPLLAVVLNRSQDRRSWLRFSGRKSLHN
ncbi:CpsD/CapB family tyrosine-protein kinase [Pseudogemmobacter faecipullorum]|uniref:CpsD/CapB family tyrosine-protein kinase n=1 Tax=Pseudogemmobacter faecipullorum TaxID=2755041 RepID=A0ABS8CGS2_9RHOB|nr:CpsD/CapB family tyrosine-protein kinase [Pseudogemmobacter faecipullorum]MCB5408580.1 CpsD/CapB family tyrosine-protein kinase [Pseudogemmobacter faecipullorum]